MLLAWFVSAAQREEEAKEANALRGDSATVRTLLARGASLSRAEAHRVDEIIHRRGFTFTHDAAHGQVIDARLDSAARLLDQNGRYAEGNRVLTTGFTEPLTAAQKARRESLQDRAGAAIAEASRAATDVLLDSAAALLRPNEDGWGKVKPAQDLLNGTGPLTPIQTTRRTELLATADRQDELIEASAQRVAAQLMLDQRKQYARKLETGMLDQNYNVTVTTQGQNGTTLRVEWILVSKVVAHQFSKEHEFFAKLKALGFERLEITDGYGESYSWDVS